MQKWVVLCFWSYGDFDINIEEGKPEEIQEHYDHNQNVVFVESLSDFLKKLKEIDIIKYMHEEHIL
jgi:hypothetical protein